MKKLFLVALVICLMSGCATSIEKENLNKDTSVVTPQDDVYTISAELDLAINCSDSKVMYQEAEMVVIATVKSIDGSNNYSEVNDMYVLPYTYGTLVIE